MALTAMDFLLAFAFWLWVEVLSLPLRFALARAVSTVDVRRLLSRVAGPLVFVLIIWTLGHFGRWALSVPVGLLLISLTSVVALVCQRRARITWRDLIAWRGGSRDIGLEITGLVLYMGFVGIRRWIPEMTFEIGASGAEKFMNSMFFFANWHADLLPAEDYWFAGHVVGYYDFAHFHWSWIARVGGFPAELGLNLALARVTLQAFEASYLLARAAGLSIQASCAASVTVAWAGNIAAIRAAWSVWQTTCAVGQPFDWGAYDFWRPSRAIAHVVDEFPAFSAILGDFHAHHVSLAWLVTWLALLVAGRRWGQGYLPLLGAALVTAGVVANLWALPVAAWIALAWALAVTVRSGAACALSTMLPTVLMIVLGLGLQCASMTFALVPPDQGTDTSLFQKLPVKRVPPERQSRPGELFDLWGLPVLAVLAAALREAGARPRPAVLNRLVGGALLGGAGVFGMPGGVVWLWGGLFLWVQVLPLTRAFRAVVFAGLVVLAGLEIVYVQDRFVGDLIRYNSYFKLSYPIWPILMILGAFAAKRLPWPLVGILVVCGGLYPALAVPARLVQAARGDQPARSATLDAVRFIAHRPGVAAEASLLEWIRRFVPAHDVVAEAALPGGYHYGGRVASLCGRPVPLGWAHHEQQWRGWRAFAEIDARAKDVDALYRAPDIDAVRRAVRALGVRWILFGINEHRAYGSGSLGVLLSTFPVAVKCENKDASLKAEWFFVFDARSTAVALSQ